MYNYLDNMKEDILEYIINDEIKQNIKDGNREEVEEHLNDSLWIDDSITGNASGSYYCNSYKAKEALDGNDDLVREMVAEFCIPAEEVAEHFLNSDYEWFDVSVRCYLLGQAIAAALDEVEEQIEEEEEQTIPEEYIETVSRNGSGSIAG